MYTRPTRNTSRRALSLLEVVCAVVVLGMATPALLVAVRDATVRRAAVQQQTIARWLVCEKLEDITADRHSATRGWSFITTANYPAEPTITGFPGFSRTTTIAETGVNLVNPGSGYRRATVAVTWSDAQRGSQSLSIATVLTDYDQ